MLDDLFRRKDPVTEAKAILVAAQGLDIDDPDEYRLTEKICDRVQDLADAMTELADGLSKSWNDAEKFFTPSRVVAGVGSARAAEEVDLQVEFILGEAQELKRQVSNLRLRLHRPRA